ncbi:agmatinase [Pseudomonas sp. Fl5BN2]|uniref:agmatinase n=1 Tax=unclassified Pseudomonas TaxID=196821 RepID=UPI0013784A2B|nr:MULTISPECIES: agmatinase [unclassified Pseudomonas]NBF02081.1 agmatinase [Pseudomonas sp. Fl5BN2]NBF07981.1 agmatinase [Pseudomonas sp. Fl4BN1]
MDIADLNDQALTRDSLYGTQAETTYAGITSFMRRRYSRDLRGVDLVVSGVPFDTATTNRPGARFGPRGIRAASAGIAWERHWPWAFDPFEHLAVIDYGDCAFDHGTPQSVPESIETHARRILDAGCAMLTLGGDHFISYPLLKAHHRRHGPLALIHFDAHSDTWPDEEGQRIDHGTMFWHAAREGLVDPARSVQIGLRTTNDDHQGFQVLDARQVHRLGCEAIAAAIRERVGDHPVYLTFDIDCLDPAFAPGTGTPVCGGLSTTQALEILGSLRGINLVGMDLVEVAPAYDHAEITSLAGATLAMEMLCLYAARHKVDV